MDRDYLFIYFIYLFIYLFICLYIYLFNIYLRSHFLSWAPQIRWICHIFGNSCSLFSRQSGVTSMADRQI